MALGKEIGHFSFKSTSSTITAGPGTAMTFQTNFEGSAKWDAGEGTAVGTLTVVAERGVKSGLWEWCGATFLNSGGAVGVKSHGTWQETGPGKWQYRGTGEDSEGVISAIESEHDLATRTLSGKNYEWK